MFDSHCHLNFQAFESDWRDVADRSLGSGMLLNIVGTQIETSKKAVAIASAYPGKIFATVGFHPTHVSRHAFVADDYAELIKKNRGVVVAVGETGFDYYQKQDRVSHDELLKIQKVIVDAHLSLAQLFRLPCVFHVRASPENPGDAYEDFYAYLSEKKFSTEGVVHCFVGNAEIAKKFLRLGLYLSFTGMITFRNASKDFLDVVSETPMNRILIETDAPYLSPEPHRGKRNEPLYVGFVAKKIAEIKKMSVDRIIEATRENAKNLFNVA